MPYKKREDQQKACREHYARNRPKYLDKAKKKKLAWKNQLAEYKEAQGCQDCGQDFPYYVLDLDHRDSDKKIANVAEVFLTKGIKAGWEEVAKCDVVCANCHRERTHSFRGGLRAGHDALNVAGGGSNPPPGAIEEAVLRQA